MSTLRIALHHRLLGGIERQDFFESDRVAPVLLGAVIVAVFGLLTYLGLVLRPASAASLFHAISASLFAAPLAMATLPVLPPFSRASPLMPRQWPLTASQRAMCDLLSACAGLWFWTAVATCAGVAIASGSLRVVLAGVMAAFAIASLVLSLQLALDVVTGIPGLRLLLAGAAAVIGVLSAKAGSHVAVLVLLPPAAVAAVGEGRLIGIPILAAQAAVSLVVLRTTYQRLYWRLPAGSGGNRRRRDAIAFCSSIAFARLLTPGARAAYALQAASMLRSGRTVFFLAHAIVGQLFIMFKVKGFEPRTVVYLLSLWASAGCCPFLYNQFAFDRRAARTLLAWPVPVSKIFAGKVAAVGTLALVPAAFLGGFAWHVSRDFATVASALLTYAFLFAANAGTGSLTSALFPVGVDPRNFSRTFLPPESGILLLLAFALCSAVAWYAWATLAPWAGAAALTALAAGAMGLYPKAAAHAATLLGNDRAGFAARAG